ncbi:MAG: methyltransferase [Polyangia bacterium]|jgi:SAM-dependent methyltransferase|nr:methyltransferase [Polyangia bacterium]
MKRRLAVIGTLALLGSLTAALGFRHLYRDRPSSKRDGDPAVVFTRIYEKAHWGTNAEGKGSSGTGSSLQSTVAYRAFLQRFLKTNRIRSVVDAGCGDWEFSKAMDWTGISYKGYDIVRSVVEENKKRYAAPGIEFFTADIVKAALPPADLLLCKEVLQHLPNAYVRTFLGQLPKYRFALITNDVDPKTRSAPNHDIQVGGYRHIDLSAAPFHVEGREVLTYRSGAYLKQVFLVERK